MTLNGRFTSSASRAISALAELFAVMFCEINDDDGDADAVCICSAVTCVGVVATCSALLLTLAIILIASLTCTRRRRQRPHGNDVTLHMTSPATGQLHNASSFCQ